MAENTAPGLFRSLRLLLSDVLEIGKTRLALLANEMEEEKLRLVGAVTQGVLAVVSLIIGAVLGVAFLTFLFWESRLLVLGGSCLLFFLLAFVFMQRAMSGLERGSALFKASLTELDADVARLRGRVGDESPLT